MENPPAPVTRGALERVLARAAELQAGRGDVGDALTEAQIIEIGKEVGLSSEHLRRALAEERARGEPAEGESGQTLVDAVLGVASASAQRVVRGTPDAILSRLDEWMKNEEWMRVVRDRPDRRVWEPRRDLLGGLRRAFSGRSHHLHATTTVAASVSAIDASRSVAALSADLGGMRRGVVAHTGAAIVVGAAAGGALLIMGVMTAVAVSPVLLMAGWSFAARWAHTRAAQRVQTALETVLDRLERRGDEPPRPPSLLKAIESALPRGL